MMEIINTVWEKRNLGCDSVEIRCTYEDENLDKERILALKQTYQVMKIPCAKTELLLQAQSLGFVMMECQVIFKTKLTDFRLPLKYERLVKDVSYHKASREEIDGTLQRVRSGNIFTTDRIALDPYFSPQIAGKRYANWMLDLLERGYALYIKTYKNQAFGWVISNVLDGNIADMVLDGNFQEKAWCGMGIAGFYILIQIARDNAAQEMSGSISTNNLRNIKIDLEFGANIEKIEYVLVKHR